MQKSHPSSHAVVMRVGWNGRSSELERMYVAGSGAGVRASERGWVDSDQGKERTVEENVH